MFSVERIFDFMDSFGTTIDHHEHNMPSSSNFILVVLVSIYFIIIDAIISLAISRDCHFNSK